MRRTHHYYMWFVALFLAVIGILGKVSFWYLPILIYITAEILTILILAILNRKVKELPKIVKKAAIQAARISKIKR